MLQKMPIKYLHVVLCILCRQISVQQPDAFCQLFGFCDKVGYQPVVDQSLELRALLNKLKV